MSHDIPVQDRLARMVRAEKVPFGFPGTAYRVAKWSVVLVHPITFEGRTERPRMVLCTRENEEQAREAVVEIRRLLRAVLECDLPSSGELDEENARILKRAGTQ